MLQGERKLFLSQTAAMTLKSRATSASGHLQNHLDYSGCVTQCMVSRFTGGESLCTALLQKDTAARVPGEQAAGSTQPSLAAVRDQEGSIKQLQGKRL